MPNDSQENSSSKPQSKQWKCGDTYQYSIPEPEGDPWDNILEPYLKEDRTKCNAWKDEVQTLLIFAGLFSAVVTAFVVQSYPMLQEDPNLILLSQIVDSLGNFNPGSIPSSTQSATIFQTPSFTPNSSSTRVNILWFLSLTLSLTTVLFGIVALQWLREHERYSHSVKSKKTLAMFRMRAEALESWYVPQIFTGLPLLLQTSLVLFFVGIVDFLLSLNRTVAIPVTVLVALTLLFIFATTVLPTFQLFLLVIFTPSTKSSIPVQCPYKSPQSWAFFRLSQWIFNNGYAVYSFFLSRSQRPSEWAFAQLPLQIFIDEVQNGWITFDSQWLRIRDAHFQFIQGLFTPSFESTHPRRPTYDETTMLVNTIKDHPADTKLVFSAYHCFQDISRNVLYRDYEGNDGSRPPQFRDRNELLRRYYHDQPARSSDMPISDMIKEPDPALLHDENMLSFIWLLGPHLFLGSQSTVIRMHLFELQSRILAHLFAEGPRTFSGRPAYNKRIWSGRICDQYKAFVIQPVFTESGPRIPKNVVHDLVEQYFMTFHSFLQIAAATNDEEIMKTTHGQEAMLLDFLKVPSLLHRYISNDATALNQAYSTFKSSLHLIVSSLENSLKSDGQNRVDFLFFCACLFARDYPDLDSTFDGTHVELIISFVTALIRYEQKLDKDRFLALFEPLSPWSVHSCFDSERRIYTFTPLKRMPGWVREAITANGILQPVAKTSKHNSWHKMLAEPATLTYPAESVSDLSSRAIHIIDSISQQSTPMISEDDKMRAKAGALSPVEAKNIAT